MALVSQPTTAGVIVGSSAMFVPSSSSSGTLNKEIVHSKHVNGKTLVGGIHGTSNTHQVRQIFLLFHWTISIFWIFSAQNNNEVSFHGGLFMKFCQC